MIIQGHNKKFKKLEVEKEVNKLEACKHLEQAMRLEWLDEKTWNTIFGIKNRLCFGSEENYEDAESLEIVWNTIHGRLKDPVLELNLLNVVYAIRNKCWEFCGGAEWRCECRNCPWEGKKEYDDEINLEDVFPPEWKPMEHSEGNAFEASVDEEEEYTDPDTLFLGEMQEYEDADSLFSFEAGEGDRERVSVISEFI